MKIFDKFCFGVILVKIELIFGIKVFVLKLYRNLIIFNCNEVCVNEYKIYMRKLYSRVNNSKWWLFMWFLIFFSFGLFRILENFILEIINLEINIKFLVCFKWWM